MKRSIKIAIGRNVLLLDNRMELSQMVCHPDFMKDRTK